MQIRQGSLNNQTKFGSLKGTIHINESCGGYVIEISKKRISQNGTPRFRHGPETCVNKAFPREVFGVA
jgi:hypothetical protein